jgi:hemerythrin
MALIDWTEKLSVGVREFDSQHKKLIALINELHEAMRVGKGKDVLERTITELVSYTRIHFSAEERYLLAKNYADYANHKAQHDQLTQKVIDFQDQHKSGKVALSLPMMNFLKEWLTQHILNTDKKYSGI